MLRRRHIVRSVGHSVRPVVERPILLAPRCVSGMQPKSTGRSYRVALVGLGYRGYRTHFLSLLGDPSVSIVAVCDTSRSALEAFSLKHSTIPAYHSLGHLLSRHDVDFAIISTPHASHMESILTTAQNGVHVLKEKPVAESIEDYQRMLALPIHVGVMFQKRFEHRFLRFRSLLPLVGKVAAVSANLGLNITNLEETWRATSGVGVTEDLGCHMIDLLVWLFGPPTSVMAHKAEAVRSFQSYSGDDVSDVIMHWRPMNCISHTRLSRVAHRTTQSITVTGTNGTLILDGDELTHCDPQGFVTLHLNIQPFEKAVTNCMVQGFGDWVKGRTAEFPTSLDKVRNTVSTTHAIKSSLASHQPQQPILPSLPLKHRSTLPGPVLSKRLGAAASFSTLSAQRHKQRSFLLNTGASVPALGLGTRRAIWPGQVYEAVRRALDCGYRHFDTAQSSGNEDEVGRAVKDSGIPRSQIWVTTKLDNKWHTRVGEALECSLRALDMAYVDLYLMHWPISIDPRNTDGELKDWNFVDTWAEMQKLPGCEVRNIGVSNFTILHLEAVLTSPSCSIIPAVNQIELHPYWPSSTLLEYCRNRRIHCTAYSCLGSFDSPLRKDPVILEISQRRRVSPQQVLIKWSIQRGTSVIPNSTNGARIKDNLEVHGWDLTDGEMESLNGCTTRFKSCKDDWLPGRVFFSEDM